MILKWIRANLAQICLLIGEALLSAGAFFVTPALGLMLAGTVIIIDAAIAMSWAERR